jgi:hypothetical protein
MAVCQSESPVRRIKMTLCPVALAVGCKKCPAFGFCPLKDVIGDHKPEAEEQAKQQSEKTDK